MFVTSFWKASVASCLRSPAPSATDWQFAAAIAPVMKLMHLLSIKHLLWPVGWQVPAGPAVDRFPHLSALVILPVSDLSCPRPFMDQSPFEFRRGAQHLE